MMYVVLVLSLGILAVIMVLVFPWIFFWLDPLIDKYFKWVDHKVGKDT